MTDVDCSNLVMIVEDDQDVRESLCEVLTDNDYRCVQASNGQEAIDRLREAREKPCVILLDIMMPVMDGNQFRSIQRVDPALSMIPVVVLTAHANLADSSNALQPAASLKKPVHVGALLSAVEQFCGKGVAGAH